MKVVYSSSAQKSFISSNNFKFCFYISTVTAKCKNSFSTSSSSRPSKFSDDFFRIADQKGSKPRKITFFTFAEKIKFYLLKTNFGNITKFGDGYDYGKQLSL